MAFIETIPVDKADGLLKKQYDLSLKRDRRVANIIQLMSQNPKALDDLLRLYTTVAYGKSSITRAQREMIALVVSTINQCHY